MDFWIHITQPGDTIWTYDATTQLWEGITASDYFYVGKGYWVHAKLECVWEVPT